MMDQTRAQSSGQLSRTSRCHHRVCGTRQSGIIFDYELFSNVAIQVERAGAKVHDPVSLSVAFALMTLIALVESSFPAMPVVKT